jgi:hypothetical protein
MTAIDLAEFETQIAPANGEESAASIKPLNIWRPSQFLEWTEPPGSHLLLPAYLTKGELTTGIGQGGIGKSRLFGLWLPICQITGREWCGIQTGGEPQKWLMLGDENSIARIKGDLQRILANLTDAERSRVDEFLRLQAILGIDDTDLNLGDATTQARIIATIESVSPGGIVADPLSNFAPGDISKPGDMKEAIRLFASTVRPPAPLAALVILHHARPGRQNIAQGVGWDSGNFGSGGKSLFAAARCQINLMPGKSDDDTRLVMSCGKSNNCQKFETRGLIFDPQTFTYTVDPDFDVDTWLADVEGRARSGQSLCTVVEVVSAVRDGYSKTKDLVEHLTEACATSKSTVERVIRKAVAWEAIKPLTRGIFTLGRKSAKYLENKGD